MRLFKNMHDRHQRRCMRAGWGPEGRGRGRHGRFGRTGRILGHGELRFLLLALIGEKPRHGYDLIKAIEEKVAGAYSPSPGVIYPTLTLLEDMGWVRAEAGEDAKKLAITAEGTLALQANKAYGPMTSSRGWSRCAQALRNRTANSQARPKAAHRKANGATRAPSEASRKFPSCAASKPCAVRCAENCGRVP